MSGHTFISHSATERSVAASWCQTLEARGLPCWMAPRDIAPGSDWAAEIIEGLDAAFAMLLLLTASAIHSAQVRREVERAVHKAIPIVTLRLDHEPLSKSLEYFLSAQHWIDASETVHEGQVALVTSALEVHRLDVRGARESRRVEPPETTATFDAGATVRPNVPRATWPQEQLSWVASRLAPYVGPIAPVLVERAARRATSEQELLEVLALEVDDRSSRERFIAEARKR